MEVNQIMKVIPAEGTQKGYHLARYYEQFPLSLLFKNLPAPNPIFHNERYTDVYFQTESGNVYKIWKIGDSWVIVDKNNKTRYRMLRSEMIYAFLKKGDPFYFAADGNSTKVIAIVAVDRSIIRIGISSTPDVPMVSYFESKLKAGKIIAKF